MTAHSLQVKAEKDIEPEDEDKTYAAMLVIFEDFINGIGEIGTIDELLEELAYVRAKAGLEAAASGFNTDVEAIIDLLNQAPEDLSDELKKRRDVLLAAFENIIDFAVAEEYQMLEDITDELDGELEFGEELEDEEWDDLFAIFERYNLTYRDVEDGDIEHALMMALGLYLLSDKTMLTYRTQLDDRVRPWHLVYEGFSAPKSAFPEWLIPPIEHGCRCFIEETALAEGLLVVKAVAKTPQMPEWFNRTFKESVANGGRIFSDEHPYFTIKEEDAERLNDMSTRIKERYLGNG